MEIEQFLVHYLNRREGEITKTFKGLPWGHWKYLCHLFRRVNFGCDFQDGLCINKRKESSRTAEPYESSTMCCCEKCANMVGYFKQIAPNMVSFLASFFDERNGFWRKGTGCVLPAGYRSEICVRYRCPDAKENRVLVGWEEYILEEVADSMNDFIKRAEIWCKKQKHVSLLGLNTPELRKFLDQDFLAWKTNNEIKSKRKKGKTQEGAERW